jgi:hypothetical protein
MLVKELIMMLICFDKDKDVIISISDNKYMDVGEYNFEVFINPYDQVVISANSNRE